MISSDGQKVLVFNGEIYNYLDFNTYKTDGECLIDLYEKYGLSSSQISKRVIDELGK